ncbi:MAG: 4-alpha-glucanotransferase [Prevotella sp.]
MKLRFRIQYKTKWGESLWLALTVKTANGLKTTKTFSQRMNTDDGEWWTAEVVRMEKRGTLYSWFQYEYYVMTDDDKTVVRREWNQLRRLYPCDLDHDYVMNDRWREVPLMAHLYSAAYKTISQRVDVADDRQLPLRQPLYRKTLFFSVSAPQISPGQSIAVCGSHPALGGWNPSRYVKMAYSGRSVWTLTMNVDSLFSEMEYKFVVIDDDSHRLLQWEGGDNHYVDVASMRDGEVLVLDGGVLRIAEDTWRVAGVALPVFSLRSEHSCGVGDFGDLVRFADWMSLAGMKMLQILPVNDTTMQHSWQDSHPYNIISVNALHPQYLDLEQVGALSDKSLMTDYNRRRTELNSLAYTDYEAVERVKSDYMHRIFDERRADIAKDDDFRQFVKANAWLSVYAAFCILRDRNHTARFSDWGKDSVYSWKLAEELSETDEAQYIFYIQYLLHKQLKRATEHARQLGIAIMGDMPIGVSRDSVEAWAEPTLFNADCQTGTVPDSLNRHGQNWGFPTYNWKVMESDGYRWWHRRLKHSEQYFSSLRIDHVLGFFRVWEIPEADVDATTGHFSPAIALTADEIGYYGLTFHKDLYTRPIINDQIVDRIFGIHANYVRQQFLQHKSYDLYDLKPECDTQRKIHCLFGGRTDESSLWIRDGLCRLATNVLFVVDNSQPTMYHPRVNAFNTTAYQLLSPTDRDAFMRLYNNYFYERHNGLWEFKGRQRLSMVFDECPMLVCAEDLGAVPSCVSRVLEQLRIPSLEVQSMPKQPDVDFSHLEANPYLSVATITTHDMPSLRLWWQDNQQRAQHYYAEMLQKEGRAPEQLTTPLAEEIVARHLYSPSMMCILSLQDWLSIDAQLRPANVRSERINTPGDSYNRWQYRMNVTIEKLMSNEPFNTKLKTMISRSKR